MRRGDGRPASSRQSVPTACILCGGLGTRLRPVLPDLPKALAPVGGRPFLARLLDQLAAAGIERVVLCTGYGSEAIEAAFGARFREMEIVISREPEQRGTAGALRYALPRLGEEAVLVLNGDSYCGTDPMSVVHHLDATDASAVMVLVEAPNTARYGRVEIDSAGTVRRFVEKDASGGPGRINAGIYCLSRRVLESIPPDAEVSLEREVFPGLVGRGLVALTVDAPFVDIGTPESLARARELLAEERDGGAG